MLSQRLDPSIEIEDKDLRNLFRRVLVEYKRTSLDARGARYFRLLWSDIAPQGNIYRRNSIMSEHRLQTEDLWIQMREIADKYKDLLGGDSVSTEERADKLYAALKETKVKIKLDEESNEEFTASGYTPLEEFLHDKVIRFGPLLVFEDPVRRAEETKHRIISLNVFLLQVIAPFLMLLNRWNMPTNYFKLLLDVGFRHSRFQLRELLCLGTDLNTVLSTILGVQLLFAVIFIARCYVDQQFNNHNKTRLLPMGQIWFFMDTFANAWCITLIVLTLPLLFWSEETPTNIVLDSMTLIFVFKLDDLSEVLCNYIGMSDEDFERLCAWAAAFTSACPVNLERLIKPDAKSPDEMWDIHFDNEGNLLGSNGKPCRTRLQHEQKELSLLRRGSSAAATERTPILRRGDTMTLPSPSELWKDHPEEVRLVYHQSRTQNTILPTVRMELSIFVWTIMRYFIYAANYVVPIGWYIINKPCYAYGEEQ